MQKRGDSRLIREIFNSGENIQFYSVILTCVLSIISYPLRDFSKISGITCDSSPPHPQLYISMENMINEWLLISGKYLVLH